MGGALVTQASLANQAFQVTCLSVEDSSWFQLGSEVEVEPVACAVQLKLLQKLRGGLAKARKPRHGE